MTLPPPLYNPGHSTAAGDTRKQWIAAVSAGPTFRGAGVQTALRGFVKNILHATFGLRYIFKQNFIISRGYKITNKLSLVIDRHRRWL